MSETSQFLSISISLSYYNKSYKNPYFISDFWTKGYEEWERQVIPDYIKF